jgi:stage V sporulation protein B
MSKIIRGLLLLSIANFVAVVIGYLIHIILGRTLGPENYGIFNVVNSLIAVTSVITLSGIPVAIAKYVSEKEGTNATMLKKGLLIQFGLTLPIFLIFILGADLIAQFMGDPSLAFLIRIAALGVPLSAMFGVLDSYLNGRKAFGKQMVNGVVLNIAKLSAVLLALLGFGVAGALGGYVFGTFCGMIIAGIFCFNLINKSKEEKQASIGYKSLIKFSIPILVFSICLTLLYNIDIISVKSLLKSDELVGFYSAASMISRVPLLFLGAISTVLFPTLSGSIASGEISLTRKYISNAIRYLVLFLLPAAVIISLNSTGIVDLIYSSKYTPAGAPLSVLFFGFVFIVFLQLFSTVINAGGKPWIIASILPIIVILSGVMNLILDPVFGILGAAISTTLAAFIGVIITGVYIHKKHGIVLDIKTIGRIIVGLVMIILISQVLDSMYSFSKLLLLVKCALLLGIYFVLLLGLGEINKEDWENLYRILPNSASGLIRNFLRN